MEIFIPLQNKEMNYDIWYIYTVNGSYYTAKYIHIGSKTKEILYQ